MQGAMEGELRSLNKKHAFGLKSDVSGCICWIDENTLAYPIGRNVVVHNIVSNSQKFFMTSDKAEAITAIALSPNKKFIAIAESGPHPQIQIIDTNTRKRRKVLGTTELGSDRFVCMQFSADGRHLATQGGAPQWNLLYWNWERSKPLAQAPVHREVASGVSRDANLNVVTNISINPRDPLHIMVTGNGVCRFYRYVDGLLKILPGGIGQSMAQFFTTQSWVTEDCIVVGSETGDLLLLQDGRLLCSLPTSPADNYPITAIVPTARGFVCGNDSGILTIYEQTEEQEMYRRVKSIDTVSEELRDSGELLGTSICALALTPGEEQLALATASQQILGLTFNLNWAKVTERPDFRYICQPFHSGSIVGLDCCLRKPLVATSSTDKTIRIWNIQDCKLEITKKFAVEPGSIALHPSGLHILVCFPDKVAFMNISGDNIYPFKTFNLRSVADVKFSVGGQYFAIVHGNVIHIYNTNTCELASQLRGHTQKLKSLQWCSTSQYPTDNRIASCSLDGMIIDWSIKDMRKESEHADKRYQYTAIASDDKNIWAVGVPTSSTAELKWKVKLREIEVQNMHGGDAVAGEYEFADIFMNSLALAPQHRLLFGGCTDGAIKLMTFPLQGGIHEPPIQSHGGAVTRLCVSFDESMLFTAGTDGSFYIFEIKEDGRVAKRETAFAEEILVSRSDLEEMNTVISNLRQTIEEIKTEMEGQEKRRDHEHGTRIRERTEEFKNEAAILAAQFANAWNAKVEQENSFGNIKREKANEAERQCDVVERAKQSELQVLDDTCKELRGTLESNQQRLAQLLREQEERVEFDRTEEENRFQQLLRQKEDNLRKLQSQVSRIEQTNRETRSQLEMDTDVEIETIRQKNDDDLLRLREKYLHMKGEGAIMKKNALVLQKEINNRAQEVRVLDATKGKLNAQIKELNLKITQLHQDIDDRDVIIGEKEKKIYELKKRNQDLEKHKFVLDHRIRQLKSQIEPKQMEIARENEKIKAKNQELSQLHQNNLALRTSIEELRAHIAQQQAQIKTRLKRLKDFDTYKGRIKRDIHEMAQLLQNPEGLRQFVDDAFERHVSNAGGYQCAPLEPELQEEFANHTKYLTKTVEALKKKARFDHEQHTTDLSNVMVENLSLIKEIQELRVDIRSMKNMNPADALGAPVTAVGPLISAASNKDIAKEIEVNRNEIRRLRERNNEIEKKMASRPSSGSRLPPVTAA